MLCILIDESSSESWLYLFFPIWCSSLITGSILPFYFLLWLYYLLFLGYLPRVYLLPRLLVVLLGICLASGSSSSSDSLLCDSESLLLLLSCLQDDRDYFGFALHIQIIFINNWRCLLMNLIWDYSFYHIKLTFSFRFLRESSPGSYQVTNQANSIWFRDLSYQLDLEHFW